MTDSKKAECLLRAYQHCPETLDFLVDLWGSDIAQIATVPCEMFTSACSLFDYAGQHALPLVRVFLEHGVDPDFTSPGDGLGQTTLSRAVLVAGDVPDDRDAGPCDATLVSLLLNYRADPLRGAFSKGVGETLSPLYIATNFFRSSPSRDAPLHCDVLRLLQREVRRQVLPTH